MPKISDSWFGLVHLVGNVESELGKVLQERHGLGLSEYRALQILSRSRNNELRMQELAAHLSLNQSSVSRMVERLERSGLTVRDTCPNDKRGVYTVLTDQGKARLESAEDDYQTALSAALKDRGCEDLLSANFIKTC